MSLPAKYPPAIQKNDGSGSGKWSTVGNWKLVLHTTETRGMPDYDGGALAPHLTFWPKRGTVTQHTPLTRPAESVLAYDDHRIFQAEIVAYSDEDLARRLKDPDALPISEITDDQLRPIADFINWLRAHGIPIKVVWPGRQALSYAEANRSGFRLSAGEFYEWPGLLGHQHVPANKHWDPGALPWDRLIAITKGEQMDHDLSTHADFVRTHDFDVMPEWIDDNDVWNDYVAAGGTTIKDSWKWPFTRSDMAWVWNRFVRPLIARDAAIEKRLAALDERVAGLELGSPSGQLDVEYVQVVKGVKAK